MVTLRIWSKQVRTSEISLSCNGSSGSMSDILKADMIVRASSSVIASVRILVPSIVIFLQGSPKNSVTLVMSMYSLEQHMMKRKREIYFSEGKEGHLGVPMISVKKVVTPSKICKALARVLEQRSTVSSLMLTSTHLVMISVPSVMKVVTFLCRASLRSRNSLSSL